MNLSDWNIWVLWVLMEKEGLEFGLRCGEFNEIEGWCMNMKSWPLKG